MSVDVIVYSDNGEEFHEDVSDVIDMILSDCMTAKEAIQRVVYVGKQVLPKISAKILADEVAESTSEWLYELIGEYSENYKSSHNDELQASIQSWLDKQDFKGWSVDCIREISIVHYITVAEIDEYYND
jgi:hypothetical protein